MYSKLPQQKTQLVAVGGFGQHKAYIPIIAQITDNCKLGRNSIQ